MLDYYCKCQKSNKYLSTAEKNPLQRPRLCKRDELIYYSTKNINWIKYSEYWCDWEYALHTFSSSVCLILAWNLKKRTYIVVKGLMLCWKRFQRFRYNNCNMQRQHTCFLTFIIDSVCWFAMVSLWCCRDSCCTRKDNTN